MNLLMDTHAFLWWITDSGPIYIAARQAMADLENALYWSAASSWEVAIKYALGRLPLPEPPEAFLPAELEKNRVKPLAITSGHAFCAGSLPPLHRDPFDRMLVAQARLESLVLISADTQLRPYGATLLW